MGKPMECCMIYGIFTHFLFYVSELIRAKEDKEVGDTDAGGLYRTLQQSMQIADSRCLNESIKIFLAGICAHD
jgi:hypothetical protein